MKNTLAYYVRPCITVKSFIMLTPETNVVKLFNAIIYKCS
jgi:hypothetical protein